MTIDKIKYRTQCYPTVSVKDKICIHFTVGSTVSGVKSSWDSVAKRDKYFMGTPYVIDRDGTIYEFFDPQFWAYHLGAGTPNEKRTIGIELVNWGPAARNKDGSFSPVDYTAEKMLKVGKKPIIIPSDEVLQTQNYKGITLWHKFSESQIKATNELLKKLCKDFGISHVVIPKERRLMGKLTPEDSEWAANFKGVLTHTNFRSDKYDIGPLWDWERTSKEIK